MFVIRFVKFDRVDFSSVLSEDINSLEKTFLILRDLKKGYFQKISTFINLDHHTFYILKER